MINFCSGTARGRTSTSGGTGTDFREYFIEDILLGIVRLNSHLKLFNNPSNHQGAALGPSPSPWRTQTSARPWADYRAYFIEGILLDIVRLVL